MPRTPPPIIMSKLSRTFEHDGIQVEVRIFRLDGDPRWKLEVISEDGMSTAWDDTFATDKRALEVFIHTVASDGIATFLDDGPPPTLH